MEREIGGGGKGWEWGRDKRVEERGKEIGGYVRKNLQALYNFFIGQDIEEAIPHPFFPQETGKSTAETD